MNSNKVSPKQVGVFFSELRIWCTYAALIALADKRPGITHANFSDCYQLTDAAVITL